MTNLQVSLLRLNTFHCVFISFSDTCEEYVEISHIWEPSKNRANTITLTTKHRTKCRRQGNYKNMILISNWIVLTSDNPKNITLRVGIRKDGEHAGYNIHFDELCFFLSCHLYDIKAYRFTSFVFCIELSKEPVNSQERKLLSVYKHENDANDMVEWERNYSLHKNNLKHRKLTETV